MRRKLTFGTVIAIIAVLAAVIFAINWFAFPSWQTTEGGSLILLGSVVAGVLGAGKLVVDIWNGVRQKEDEEKQGRKTEAIKRISLDELFKRLGRGGQVNWIDRGITNAGQLHAHGRIVITGRMKLGKTREALELIRRAVDHIVMERRLYEPGPALRFLNKASLEKMLGQDIDPKAPILVFLDDLPYHYYGEGLKDLKEFIRLLEVCKEVFLVATARLDQMTDEHRNWLKEQRFFEIRMIDLNAEQTGRVVDAAAGVFGLQVEDGARKRFMEEGDGTPELPLISLRLIRERGEKRVSEKVAEEVTKESLKEAWAAARLSIEKQHPVSGAIFDGLGIFKAAGIDSDTYLVLHYARTLIKKTNRQLTWWKQMKNLQKALDYLANFDIVNRDGVISHSDVITEGLSETTDAQHRLGDFLMRFRRINRNRIFRRFYSHSERHAMALRVLGTFAREHSEYHQALKLYQSSLSFSNNEYTFYERGITFEILKNYNAALADFTRAIELDPQDSLSYFMRGLIYSLLEETSLSLVEYNRAIELNSEYGFFYRARGDVYNYLKDYPAALADYKGAIELDPQSAQAYNNRGSTYGDLKDYPAALADYNRAIELDPQSAQAYNNRGSTYTNLKDYPAALADYMRAIELDPQDAMPVYNMACCHALQGEIELACDLLRRAINLDKKYIKMACEDADFDAIRQSEEFQALLKEFGGC